MGAHAGRVACRGWETNAEYETERRAKAEAQERARLVKERAAAEKKLERDVDAELKALKKRLQRAK